MASMVGSTRSARTGDRVRAERSHRDATPVTGILHLRFIPSLNYAQVNVVLDSGRSVSVDPQSVGVVEAGVASVDELEAGDPVRADTGWRRVVDLDEATAEGLVRPVVRDGLSWADLFERMRRVLQPLVDAGWEVSGEETDETEDECVVCCLQRGEDRLSVDHYPDGWTHIWITDEEGLSGEDAEAIAVFPDDDAGWVAIEHGWIDPDHGQESR